MISIRTCHIRLLKIQNAFLIAEHIERWTDKVMLRSEKDKTIKKSDISHILYNKTTLNVISLHFIGIH